MTLTFFNWLLALLAFWLLIAEQKKDKPREIQIKVIQKFMSFSIVIGVLAFTASILPILLEEKPNPLLDAMVESQKNRRSLPLEFIESQIAVLTSGHDERINLLYQERKSQEKLLEGNVGDQKRRAIEKRVRKIEQYIREENRDYKSKISDFRKLL